VTSSGALSGSSRSLSNTNSKKGNVVVMRVTDQEGQSHDSLPVYIEHFVLHSPYNTTLLDTPVYSSTEL
jgi:hypothetical protein